MAKTEKVTLNYIIGEQFEVKDRIIIAFEGTGLNINNSEHKHFLDVLAKVMITQMYAKANDISIEDVKY
jgi:hypothetical protein